MKTLGPVLITKTQQSHLKDELLLHVQISQACYPEAAERALHGDLWWVREPYVHVTGKNIPGIVIGFGNSPANWALPKDLQLMTASGGQLQGAARMIQCTGEYLDRTRSRATLQIMSVLEDRQGWRCKVWMRHVDEVSKMLRARA